MSQGISDQDGRNLVAFLSGEYVIPLCEGKAWLYCTPLPGDTAAAAAQMHDGLHVFLDLNKPAAYAHAREMLREWLGYECPDMDRVIELSAVA